MKKSATFSKCKKYRYELWRIWGKNRPFVLFVCLNPSIADHKIDSRTSKRCIRFAQDWGYEALCMVNLFAFRSQNPKNLLTAIDPIGQDNDNWIIKLSSEADLVVAAWGNAGTLNNRDQQIINLLPEPHYFKLTKKGVQDILYIFQRIHYQKNGTVLTCQKKKGKKKKERIKFVFRKPPKIYK